MQALRPLRILLRLDGLGFVLQQIGLRLVEHGFGLFYRGFVRRLVDIGQFHVFFNEGIVIDRLAVDILAKTGDQTSHLGTDVDQILGLQGPGGADGGRHVAPLDRRHTEFRCGRGSRVLGIVCCAAYHGTNQNKGSQEYPHRTALAVEGMAPTVSSHTPAWGPLGM